MKVVCRTLINRRTFAVEIECESFGLICWICMQLVAMAVTLGGPIRVYPSDENGEPIDDHVPG